MKNSILAVIVAVLLTAITMSIYQQRLDNQKVKERIERVYGEGDMGSEMEYILLTEDNVELEAYIQSLEE